MFVKQNPDRKKKKEKKKKRIPLNDSVVQMLRSHQRFANIGKLCLNKPPQILRHKTFLFSIRKRHVFSEKYSSQKTRET